MSRFLELMAQSGQYYLIKMKRRKYYYSDEDYIYITQKELELHNNTQITKLKWLDLEEEEEHSENQ